MRSLSERIGSMALVLGAITLAASGPAKADEIADFYRGKTISLVVSTASGGGYDIWARLLARHFSRNMPGNPDIVVQNTPGSGGLARDEHDEQRVGARRDRDRDRAFDRAVHAAARAASRHVRRSQVRLDRQHDEENRRSASAGVRRGPRRSRTSRPTR